MSVQRSGKIVRDFKIKAIDILLANDSAQSDLALANLLKEFKAFSELEKVIARLSSVVLSYQVKSHGSKSEDSISREKNVISSIQNAINKALNKGKPDSANTALAGLLEEVKLIQGLLNSDSGSQSGANGGVLTFLSQFIKFSPPPASLKQSIEKALCPP